MATATIAWNNENVELLTKLWNDGLSASLIAARIGGITRNAVIGKVHRLGLPGRRTMDRLPPYWSLEAANRRRVANGLKPIKRRSYKPTTFNVKKSANGTTMYIPSPSRTQREHADVLPALNVALIDLKRDMCRYPTGDGCYCGHPVKVKDGKVGRYCSGHAIIMYAPPSKVKCNV